MAERNLTTGELARALGVSPAAVLRWARAEAITPTLVTPGGHYRWREADVRAELERLRLKSDDE